MGTYGQELLGEALMQALGAITLLCGAICTTPPTSIVGVILWTGYFVEAALSHLRIGHLPTAFISLGLCFALMLWVALGLHAKGLRASMLPQP
jgi:hypothetical protein